MASFDLAAVQAGGGAARALGLVAGEGQRFDQALRFAGGAGEGWVGGGRRAQVSAQAAGAVEAAAADHRQQPA